jgi:Tfp pilus assembly protein PilF
MAKLGPVLVEVLQVTQVRNGPEHVFTAMANYNVGLFFLRQKDYARAEPYLRKHLSFSVKNNPEHWARFRSESKLGRCLLGQKRYAEAERLLLSAYNGMKLRAAGPLPANQIDLRNAVEWIAQLYDEWGAKDKAKEWSRRFDELAFPKSPFAPP